MTTEEDLRAGLDEFVRHATPGPFSYEYAHHHAGSGKHGLHLVFGFLIHGNEFGTLPAALGLLEALRSGRLETGGPVTLFLGNPEAALKDERFLEEDLNRVFTFDRAPESHERRRADATRPILDAADYFFDFHQTQTPSARPFWTFPWRTEFGLLARALRIAEVGLTRPDGQAFSPGLCCLDEYVRNRGKIGLTVEVGERGFNEEQAERTYQGALRAIELIDRLGAGASLETLASAEPALRWYQTQHIVRAETPEFRLRPGYENWSEVKKGDLLSASDAPRLVAPCDGSVLFPKYPKDGQPPPPELMRIAALVDAPAAFT